MVSLDELIVQDWESLMDSITKDAIRQIPSYAQAPIRLTIERVERWLKTLSDSVAQNNPQLLAEYLAAVGEERKEEGYPIGDLQTIVHVTERHLGELIAQSYPDPVERAGQTALLQAIMESARMTLSVSYILSVAARESQEAE